MGKTRKRKAEVVENGSLLDRAVGKAIRATKKDDLIEHILSAPGFRTEIKKLRRELAYALDDYDRADKSQQTYKLMALEGNCVSGAEYMMREMSLNTFIQCLKTERPENE